MNGGEDIGKRSPVKPGGGGSFVVCDRKHAADAMVE